MKHNLLFALITLLMLIVIPLAGVWPQLRGGAAVPQPTATTAAQPAKKSSPAKAASNISPKMKTIDVFRAGAGETETIPIKEYLVGCIAAEILPSTHEEAIKAQAVASYTYARYRTEIMGKAALSDSGATDQGYQTPAQRRESWGVNFEYYEAKLEKAVQAVLGQTITYEGKPILAAYHFVSPGKTESALHYWGEDYPYLQAAESTGDRLSPEYSRTKTMSEKEIKKALKEVENLKLGDMSSKWFGKPKLSPSGSVLELPVGNQMLSGPKLRRLLGLRSAAFTITFKNGDFLIETKGYGHGVGMSQYGADFMARQGSDYIEILQHYYKGVEIF